VTNRQKKINALLQQDLAEIIQQFLRKENLQNILVTVTAVRVTTDLHVAKAYLSVFPFKHAEEILDRIKDNSGVIKNNLGQRVRNQLRVVPDLLFFLDDSLQLIEKIDRSLNDPENPLNP
jgi:ribosome-binding factor A